MSYLKSNLDTIYTNIEAACKKSGRNPEEVKVIAVTKTVESDVINEAISTGVNAIGENRVQEITRKFDDIENVIEWHLIGHLQRNKVKYIIDKVDLIHSVDSVRLAKEINNQAKNLNKVMPILVQINVAKEESKFGIEKTDVHDFMDQIREFEHLKVKGLMTIAPFYDDPEDVRIYFRELKGIFDQLKDQNEANVDMQYLSMGMTNDYEVAIEEGANMVRIGTGIFGRRNYT